MTSPAKASDLETAAGMRSLSELMDLTGRSALITGGAGHIALAAAEALTELGARVAILDVDDGACRERAALLCKRRADSAVPVVCDLADEQATRKAVRETVTLLGGLDVLIHAAASVGTSRMPGWAVPLPQQSVPAWDAGMRVNLTSAFVLAQEAHPALSASGRGSMILFSSIAGMVGPDMSLFEGTEMAKIAAYAASKGGLVQLTRYLATLFAPRVRVNTISPGGIWRGQPEIFRQRYEARTPMKRMAHEEDMKGAVAYLASDLSAYVTGHNIVIDGGWTAW